MIDFLKTLLVLTAAGTLCGLFLAALRKLPKGKVPSSFLYFAWIIVVLRFAIPINGLVPVGSSAPHVEPLKPSYTEPLEPQQFPTVTEAASVPSTYSRADAPIQPMQNQSVTEQFAPVAKKNVSFPTILFVVWCCGTTGFLLWNIISYVRFMSLMRKGLASPSFHDVDLYDAVYDARKPKLKRSRVVSTPLTFGIVDPVLVIPDAEYEDATLKNVFQHEIIHFRRHDILLKWFSLIVFSAHWFNPFVWYFRKEIDRVCELSCDEALLKRMNDDEKRSYGETLLKIAEDSCAAPSRMITGFSEGKKDLKERLIQIMSFKKKGKAAIALALIPVLILCGCAVALGPKAEKMSGADSVTVSNVDELLAAIAPNTEIHLSAGTYNLTEAANYGNDHASDYYHWQNYGFENQYELCIEDVDNLTMIGDNAEILTVPRSANVLAFRNCDQLFLQSLTVGHTEAAEACEGGVIRLDNCLNGAIDSCNLYGCGTVGVWAEESSNLSVSNTQMYHCSTAGISFSNAVGLAVDGCSIYDCGKQEKYQSAAGAFSFYNASAVSVTNCDVYNNYLQTLIQGNAVDMKAERIRVHDNHISTAFYLEGDAEFSELSFTGNTIDRWMDEYRTGTITIDGKKYSEEEFAAVWGEQMSAAGIGAAEAEMVPIDRTGTKEVHIKTADEFLSAIASDTTVYIDVPQIDLTECSSYGEGATEEWLQPEFGDSAYAWVCCYDGYELFIGNVSNFHIVGGEIVTQPRYANVLNYVSCSGVTLENVYLGHTPEQGTCSGGVLNLQDSDHIILESCDLYGCGILGIQAWNVQYLNVQNTLIHDCSSGAAMLADSDNVVFLGCGVANCPNPHFSLTGCDNFSWDKRLMDPFSTFNVNDDARNYFQEALNSGEALPVPMHEAGTETATAVSVACMVVDAYVKGYEDFELTILSYLSRTSAIGVFSKITACDFPVYYETSEGVIPADQLFPAKMIQICRMDGADEITDDEPEGTTRTIFIYFRTSADHPEQESSYFKVDLIREDGCWRVVRF
ncbi:MAG: right-handed parallel beta-helix repeat-containing protein [Oscillospiraceae bacterium]|nr:right-handed parallel beta-helix repeat-containing protein [Oscillospiraceae bacterium]